MIIALMLTGAALGYVLCAWSFYQWGKSVGSDTSDTFYDNGFKNGYRAALSENGLLEPWGKSDLMEDMEEAKS